MLESLKKEVYEANMELVARGLVINTWGNVSGIDRASGLVVIKPSGVPYDELTPDCLPVLDLDGRVIEGRLKPSSDTPTHLALYRAFPEIGGVTHTQHTPWRLHRRAEALPHTARHTPIIFPEQSPVPEK